MNTVIWLLILVDLAAAIYLLASILGALGRIEQKLSWMLEQPE